MYDEPKASGVSRLAVALGSVSLAALVVAGPLHRFGLIGLMAAFGVLKWAVYGAMAALLLSIGGIAAAARRRASKSAATAGLLLALGVIMPVGALAWKASRVPA